MSFFFVTVCPDSAGNKSETSPRPSSIRPDNYMPTVDHVPILVDEPIDPSLVVMDVPINNNVSRATKEGKKNNMRAAKQHPPIVIDKKAVEEGVASMPGRRGEGSGDARGRSLTPLIFSENHAVSLGRIDKNALFYADSILHIK
ncbi:hypothetical protein GEV33_005299 [Tenebrio molitor]|uniref:Uncharacterized protein n=1 Tax=Tenebrio molitor TaxID=7067 RepID=A0A8J6LEZ9_TENMO|nr:hypothetical protein GEV33_005299 [Tenebrio molitor]